MSRVSRALLIIFCLSLVWILLVIAIAMGEAPPWRGLAISFFIFWFFAYLLFRYLAREPKSAYSPTSAQPVPERAHRFLRAVPILGKLYLASGAIAILLGFVIDEKREMFLTLGVVVWFFAAYLLFMARSKSTR